MSATSKQQEAMIQAATNVRAYLQREDGPRGTFDHEYDRIVATAIPATGDPIIPREVVRRVFNEMRRVQSMDWGFGAQLEQVRETDFWVSYAYMLAVAARDAGTVKPAPKPEEVDRIARKAFEDYTAGRTDSKGNPTPAPVCARCGGRGCVPRVYLGTGTVGEDDCPDCRGKP